MLELYGVIYYISILLYNIVSFLMNFVIYNTTITIAKKSSKTANTGYG